MEIKLDLSAMLERYSHYGWSKRDICSKWGVNSQRFYLLKKYTPQNDKTLRRIQLNTITDDEKQAVKDYALSHTQYNHRELSYRMIDENSAFMSSSSVYRILRENNLLPTRKTRSKPENWDPHKKLCEPDQVWQTDLMVITFGNRDYYFLSYMDIYSRFIVYYKLCTSMTGDTIKEATQQAFKITNKKPKVVQSDNGSCYISQEYRSYLAKSEINHHRIHPHCPNENAEIERYHRTVRELLDPYEAKNLSHLLELIKEQIHIYNYCRYHSAIGFITPHSKYTNKEEKIFIKRKQKLKRAKEKRIKWNILLNESRKVEQKAA